MKKGWPVRWAATGVWVAAVMSLKAGEIPHLGLPDHPCPWRTAIPLLGPSLEGLDQMPPGGVVVVGSGASSPLRDEEAAQRLVRWIEEGGRALLILDSAGWALPGLAPLGLHAAPKEIQGLAVALPSASESLDRALAEAAAALKTTTGSALISTEGAAECWPLLGVRPEGAEKPVAYWCVERPMGQGGFVALTLPPMGEAAGDDITKRMISLIGVLIEYIRESYDRTTALERLERLATMARERVEEMRALIATKAGSISPNEMNSPKGDPWYRVPGSSGDRLTITPEIATTRDGMVKEAAELRRRVRALKNAAEPPPLAEIKTAQRDASDLAARALRYYNYITLQ